MTDQWQQMCATESIDPREVELIHERYAAYRDFTGQGPGNPISLDQWFRFYHLEKNSEGVQAGAPVEGCSADGDAVNQACLERPGVFLAVLKAYDEAVTGR